MLSGRTSAGYVLNFYRNDGDGVFTGRLLWGPGVQIPTHASGDYDGDGDLDLIVSGNLGSTPHTRILRNDGAGVFTTVDCGFPDVEFMREAWGDCDNDGDLDLLLVHRPDPSSPDTVYRNDGNDVFTALDALLPGVSQADAAWADFDGDGFQDILLCGWTGNQRIMNIYVNGHDGTFADAGARLPGVRTGSVACEDFDGDGDQDILVSGNGHPASFSSVLRNDGDLVFTDVEAGLPPLTYSSTAWGISIPTAIRTSC